MLAVCRAISACGARLSSGHVRPNDPSSLIGMPVTAAETFDTGRCIGPKRVSAKSDCTCRCAGGQRHGSWAKEAAEDGFEFERMPTKATDDPADRSVADSC